MSEGQTEMRLDARFFANFIGRQTWQSKHELYIFIYMCVCIIYMCVCNICIYVCVLFVFVHVWAISANSLQCVWLQNVRYLNCVNRICT